MSAPLPVISPQVPGAGKALPIDARAYERGLACVHCGLCLPACPTYTQNGHEGDSPRGRIQLMLGLAEGKIEPTESVRRHLDLCLDCRACETACPSGVVYHELLEETRARLAASATPTLEGRLMRWLFLNVFTRPGRLRLALLPARILQKAGVYPLFRRLGLSRLLPAQFRKMEQMLPAGGPLWPRPLPEVTPAAAARLAPPRPAIGFFAGCIGSVMFDTVNRQAVELLAACGAEVRTPRVQGCCGAIHHHNGFHEPAAEMARRNIDAFFPAGGPGVDVIVSTVAGCGAMLREYDVLLRDDPAYADRAKQFVARVCDITEVLVELGLPEMKFPVRETVTYHDACHLAHAQKVTAAPRQLLARIPGLTVVPLPESDMCCGAAGTYNLTHPDMAGQLARRKLEHIASTGAGTCVTCNAGCSLQIQSQAEAQGMSLRVVHPVELLHRAVFGK